MPAQLTQRCSLCHVPLDSRGKGGITQQQEAIHLWEKAIAAKGGRERLHSVHNMVVSASGDYESRLFGKNQVGREELLVFPNKYWVWEDYRPDVFGLKISMYKYDTNMFYTVSEGNPKSALQRMTDTRRNKALRNAQLSFLLETEWLKPIIVKASTGRVGLRPVDIVQTMVEDERIDFAFDRATHLPVRISYHDVFENKTYVNVQSFSTYTDVSGIKVPQMLEYIDGSRYKTDVQFNVEYDQEVFVKPSHVGAGPRAWKVTTRRQ